MNTFIQNAFNTTTTENGAFTYKSSLSKCLDLFSMGVSSSNKEDLIKAAFDENPILAVKTALYLRDVRNGQGNKDIGRALHKVLALKLMDSQYSKLLNLLPEIGSWKDVYELYELNSSLQKSILALVSTALKNNDSLAAKWFKRQSKIHKDLAVYWNQDIGEVRRFVASLTNVVETAMCNKQWHTINYEQVPSRANLVYSKAFLRNDSSRRQDFLNKTLKGEAKINASVLYPHEVVVKAIAHDVSADALWKALPNYMEGSEPFNILPVVDVSGSMGTKIAGSTTSCMTLAIALGLYISERNTGAYKDIMCTFHSSPSFVKAKGNTLKERVYSTMGMEWGGSTNLQATFDLILKASLASDVKDTPKMVLIVSDMEFDSADYRFKTNFEAIKDKYAQAGIEMPVVVFWRVDVKNEQQPVKMDTTGSILINGYSPSILKTILANDVEALKQITPMNLFLQAVAHRYPEVEDILKEG